MHEGIPIINMRVPKEFCHEHGKLKGVLFEIVRAEYDAKGRRSLVPTGEPHEFHECDEVLVAIGQENAFPWIEKDIGLEFDKWGLPVLNEGTLQSTLPKVFFAGGSAFGELPPGALFQPRGLVPLPLARARLPHTAQFRTQPALGARRGLATPLAGAGG